MNLEEVIKKIYNKDDKEAYHNLITLENIIENNNYLYEYFDKFMEMLDNEKSYIRVRGFRIICKLAKWDKENKININIDKIMSLLNDDKPTAVRQYLKALNYLLLYKTELFDIIKEHLKGIDYLKYKDSMQGLIKKDIDSIIKE